MNTVLIILAVLLVLIGIAGSTIPGIAGPPFSWLALLLHNFTAAADYTSLFLVATAAVAVVITILDYIRTTRHGGSKAGVWGCNIGLVVSIIGLPFGPTSFLGVIFWPFVGALVGELLNGKQSREALRAA